ncbi:hypothetical protein OH784_24610 [Ectobacillus funiculus]|uniref:hypothetical protein n=1 Tax=Ectobacillus funiculus TaxID=137993 RepID=UPI003978D98C
MVKVLGILFIGALITLLEVPSLKNKNHKKDIFMFFLLLSIGTMLTILVSLGIDIPTPLGVITKLYNPISSYLERVLS